MLLRLALFASLLCFASACGSNDSDANDTNNANNANNANANNANNANANNANNANANNANNTIPPEATIKDIEPYDAVSGEAEIEIDVSDSVDKVELLLDDVVVATADAAPFTLTWDTTKAADGVAKLTLKAHAGSESATSEELPLVVLNNGEAANWIDGNGGVMEIIPGYDTHHKYHWMMPENVYRVISVLFWDNEKFEMDLAIGVGTCPHSGTEATREASKTSPLMVDYALDEGLLTTATWFAHGGATNEADLENEQTTVLFKTYLFYKQ